jgi:hypothetical protein
MDKEKFIREIIDKFFFSMEAGEQEKFLRETLNRVPDQDLPGLALTMLQREAKP